MKQPFDFDLDFSKRGQEDELQIVSQTAPITSKVQFQFHPSKTRISTFSIINLYCRSPFNEIANISFLNKKSSPKILGKSVDTISPSSLEDVCFQSTSISFGHLT